MLSRSVYARYTLDIRSVAYIYIWNDTFTTNNHIIENVTAMCALCTLNAELEYGIVLLALDTAMSMIIQRIIQEMM